MKGFQKFKFKQEDLKTETAKLRALLQPGAGRSLGENEHLSPLFKTSPNIVSIIASAFGNVTNPDLIANEYWILDKLRSDFAAANSHRNRFCFIEIEDATPASIFVERKPDLYNGLAGRPPYYDWAPRHEHGTSQMIDWIRILHDAEKTDDFRSHFGSSNKFEATFILVIGRDEYLDGHQRERIAWRSKHVQTAGHKIKTITFDEVLNEAEHELTLYPELAAAATPPPAGGTGKDPASGGA